MTEPILPEPAHYWQTEVAGRAVPLMAPLFTAGQMRAYAAAARAQALEDAARVCEKQTRAKGTAQHPFWNDCAAAIRAMKDKT